eukprot:2361168-Pyramimonas_sp.AAC.1
MSTVQCVARVHTGSDDILYRRQSNATARVAATDTSRLAWCGNGHWCSPMREHYEEEGALLNRPEYLLRQTRLGANASDYRKAVFFIKQLLKRGNHLVVHQVADSRFTVVHSLALVDPIAVDIDWLREI